MVGKNNDKLHDVICCPDGKKGCGVPSPTNIGCCDHAFIKRLQTVQALKFSLGGMGGVHNDINRGEKEKCKQQVVSLKLLNFRYSETLNNEYIERIYQMSS